MSADGTLDIAGLKKKAAIGGDKGYYALLRIGETIFVLTETAAEAALADEAAGAVGADADDDARDADRAAPKKSRGRLKKQIVKDFMAKHPNAILHPFFASHRSVVERVFGFLKQKSKFLAGPIYYSQAGALTRVIKVLCALHNVILLENPHLHVRKAVDEESDSAPINDGSPADSSGETEE